MLLFSYQSRQFNSDPHRVLHYHKQLVKTFASGFADEILMSLSLLWARRRYDGQLARRKGC